MPGVRSVLLVEAVVGGDGDGADDGVAQAEAAFPRTSHRFCLSNLSFQPPSARSDAASLALLHSVFGGCDAIVVGMPAGSRVFVSVVCGISGIIHTGSSYPFPLSPVVFKKITLSGDIGARTGLDFDILAHALRTCVGVARRYRAVAGNGAIGSPVDLVVVSPSGGRSALEAAFGFHSKIGLSPLVDTGIVTGDGSAVVCNAVSMLGGDATVGEAAAVADTSERSPKRSKVESEAGSVAN